MGATSSVPRIAAATLCLLTAPTVFAAATIGSHTGFLLVRFFAGFSVPTIVSTHFLMSSMFSAPDIGSAEAVAAGWGNLGRDVTRFLMPLLYKLVRKAGAASFTAWRITFFVPGTIQMLSSFAVLLFGQDFPDGNYYELHNSGEKVRDNAAKIVATSATNYRAWILALTYGVCFGVELTVDNIIAEYFFDRFHLNLHTAGLIAASFRVANLVSRPAGGWASDLLSEYWGMRGRLWGLWVMQSLGGLFCVLLGLMLSFCLH